MFSTVPFTALITAVLTRAPAAIVCALAYLHFRRYQDVYPRSMRWAKLGFVLGGIPFLIFPITLTLEFGFIQRMHGSGIPFRTFIHFAYFFFQNIFWAILNASAFYCLYKSIQALLEPRDA